MNKPTLELPPQTFNDPTVVEMFDIQRRIYEQVRGHVRNITEQYREDQAALRDWKRRALVFLIEAATDPSLLPTDNEFTPSQTPVSLPSAPNPNQSSFRQLIAATVVSGGRFCYSNPVRTVFLRIGRAIVSQAEVNLVDVALLVDASNSLQDDISAVINHLSHMVEVMEPAKLDFNFGPGYF